MTSPFDPRDVPKPRTDQRSGSSNILPNGQYDIYNLGDLADRTILLGTKKSKAPLPGYLPGEAGSATYDTPATTTPQEYLKKLASLSVSNPEAYAQIQSQLFNAGFYGSTKPRYGIYSPRDASAVKEMVEGYLGVVNSGTPTPLTITDYLNHASAQGAANAKSDAAAAASQRQVAVSDPESIKSAAQQAAQAALGRGLSDKQLNHFVEQFQAMQQQAGMSSAATVESPDLGAQAMQYVQDENPDEYEDTKRQSYTNTLVNMFAPPESQRPNMAPVASA